MEIFAGAKWEINELNLTELEWTEPIISGIEVNRNEQKWNNVYWIAYKFIDFKRECAHLKWYVEEAKWAELNGTDHNWTEIKWTALNWTELD